MATKTATKASMPNPALEPFKVLIGHWRTTGSHPHLPGVTLHGRTTIEWLEGGAFLIIRSEIDHPKFPQAIQIIGSDDRARKFFLLHFDDRGISRQYDVSISTTKLKWSRTDAEFSQTFTMTITANSLSSRGEMKRLGSDWEKDLSLKYERI